MLEGEKVGFSEGEGSDGELMRVLSISLMGVVASKKDSGQTKPKGQGGGGGKKK